MGGISDSGESRFATLEVRLLGGDSGELVVGFSDDDGGESRVGGAGGRPLVRVAGVAG